MAQRRMTSLEVIDTDAFLDMPVSSQLLYFHLNARADDDGFVASPQKIIRSLGGSADDLKILIAKKFVIAFDDGVCVIKHWRVNNFVRKDIYKSTNYLDLKRTLFIRSNGAYTLTNDDRAIPVPDGHFKLEYVDVTLTGRQLRIGKVSKDTSVADAPLEIVSYSEEDERPARGKKDTAYKQVFALFSKKQQGWMAHKPQIDAAKRLLEQRGLAQVQKALDFYEEHKDEPYMVDIDTPYDLEAKWPKLLKKANA